MKPRESKCQNLSLITKNSDIKTFFLKSCQTTKKKYDYTVRKHWASRIELKCTHGTLKPSSEDFLSENIRQFVLGS